MGWVLVAIHGVEPRMLTLPASGSVVLGREAPADLLVDAPSISRRHVAFHVEGEDVFVEDLGSANGSRTVTVVADAARTAQSVDRRLEPNVRTKLEPGVSLHLGNVILVLRKVSEEIATEGDVIARSPAMKKIMELVGRIAPAPLSVLIVGETGVGKDVVARAIHRASSRKDGPFVAINCAALPDQLVESELFGHEKGSFTGALAQKVGLLEAANGGTCFLDEVGELPMAQQSKLLRALEAREVQRVGALKARPIDVRFVAATNRDPARDAEGGKFRQDLYFRLNGMTVAIPPLRERPEDLEPLASAFAQRAAKEMGRPAPRFDEGALAALRAHPFPGNVRELRNVIDRAVALAGSIVSTDHLFLDAARPASVPPPAPAGPRDAERQRILDALAQCGGNQTRAAQLLGISRRTLVTRLGEYGIARPHARSQSDE